MNKVEVIIPVYKPDELFDRLLKKLKTQTLVPDKIHLIWTVTSDIEKEPIRDKYENEIISCHFVYQNEFDHGGTRARAVAGTESEYVLCMTQDAVPADNFVVEKLLAAFDNDNIAAAYARQLARDNAGAIETITREFNYPSDAREQNKDTLELYGIKTFFCSNVCAMYKRKLYEKVGGFVNKTIFNEDMIIAASFVDSGYTVRYVPEAKVVHSHHYSYRQQYRRNFDLAVSQTDHPEVFERVPSESEGIRLVKKSALKLIKMGKFYLIPDLILQSGFKYLGYKKGKKYKSLSKGKILKYTMNKSYWSGE